MKPKSLLSLTAAVAIGSVGSLSAENTIVWETLGNGFTPATGAKYIQRFTVEADGPFERMAFCAFKRGMKPLNPADTIVEILPGYFAVESPRFSEASPSRPIVIDIITDGSLRSISYTPDGMHLVADGKAVPAKNVKKSIIQSPAQYVTRSAKGTRDLMIYGETAFAINDSLRSDSRPRPYMGIPTPKSVRLTGKKVTRPLPEKVRIVKVEN